MLMDSDVLYCTFGTVLTVLCTLVTCIYIYQQCSYRIRKLVQVYSGLNVYTLGHSTRRVQVADHVMYSILISGS